MRLRHPPHPGRPSRSPRRPGRSVHPRGPGCSSGTDCPNSRRPGLSHPCATGRTVDPAGPGRTVRRLSGPPRHSRHGPRAAPRPDPAPPRGRRARAVADEHIAGPGILRALRGRTGGPTGRRRRSPGIGCTAGRTCPGARPRPGAEPRQIIGHGPHRDRHQRCPHRDFFALLAEAGGHHAPVRAGHLHHRLGGLDLHDRLVDGDHLADLDHPAHDRRLGQALAQVGQGEFADRGHHSPRPSVQSDSHWRRATASRTRSTPGRWCRSSIGGGYGMSKPATRRTGASRWWKQRSVIRAAISPPGPPNPWDSCDDHGPPGPPHRRADRLVVERHQRAQVDHLQVPALGAGGLGGLHADRERRAVGDQRGALPRRRTAARPERRDPVRRVGRPVGLGPVQPLGLQEDHRVVGGDRRAQQPVGVRRRSPG